MGQTFMWGRVVGVLALASMTTLGCATGAPPPSGGACGSSDECAIGERCVAGRCETARGRVDEDGGMEAPPPPSGPECANDGQCGTNALCLSGSCCYADSVCGDTCCGDGQVCLALTCVTPGADCHSQADCGEGEYCEPSLDPSPGDLPSEIGPLCVHDAPADGRCVALPRVCATGESESNGCLAACEYHPPVEALSAVPEWHWGESAERFPNKVDVWSTPAVGRIVDSNCDGRTDSSDAPNVVFVSNDVQGRQCAQSDARNCHTGVLRVLDGASGDELFTLDGAEAGSVGFAGVSVALADTDHDGALEIFAATGEGKLAWIGGDGSVRAISPSAIPGSEVAQFGWGGGLAIADMEGDGNVEIAFGATVFTLHEGVLSLRFQGAFGRGGGISSALSSFADLDGDGRLELVAGNTVYRADGTTMWRDTVHGDGFNAVADLDTDGDAEVVLVIGGAVYVLDGRTGSTVAELALPGTGAGGPPTVADFDGDHKPEIGVAKAQFYSVLDFESGALTVKWSSPNHDLSSSVTGSTVFDFEGDGRAEVIYNDECFLWVYDGMTGAVRYAALTSSFTGTEASIVADIDGDRHADILFGSNGVDMGASGWKCNVDPWNTPDPTLGRPAWVPPSYGDAYRGITVLRDVADSWVGTRALWNQHTYHVTNVCDASDDACEAGATGSVPARERASWSVDWLNSYRQNVQGAGIFDAPDATVTLVARCETPVVLEASVRNLGQAPLPSDTKLDFFVVREGREEMIGMVATDVALQAGQTQILTLEAPASVPGEIFRARIHVDAAARTFRECREDNNTSPDAALVCLL